MLYTLLILAMFSANPASFVVTVTAYNAEVGQTDSSPFITASNKRVREGIIAVSRDLEREYGIRFGDVVHLEDLGEFEVQDRMNRRYRKRVDIFMWSRDRALKFGKQKKLLTIK